MTHDHHAAKTVAAGGAPARPPLSRLLAEEGIATRAEVQAALDEGARTGERLGEVLLRRQIVDERQLARLLARQWELPYLDAEEFVVEPDAVSILGAPTAAVLGALPVEWHDHGVRVVLAEPTEERMGEVRRRIDTEVVFGVVTASGLARLLDEAGAGASGGVANGTDSAPPPSEASGFDEILAELDDGTLRLTRLRERVEQLAGRLSEQETHVARLEGALAESLRRRDQDEAAIARLQARLDEREAAIAAVRAKLAELGDALAPRSAG